MATVKALVIGGGWWAAWWGGWWGGYQYNASFTVTPQAYPVTVGTGWAWKAYWVAGTASNGTDSVFSTITGTGWWGGASLALTGANGWCGGWGRWSSGVGGTGSQWWNGGTAGTGSWYYGCGGWWGTWWNGSNANSAVWGGNGWVGTFNSISWTSIEYGGGGWGACDNPWVQWVGTWWWGTAVAIGTPNNWTNWLGWGGGGNNNATGGNGWNGVVIISYATDGSDWVSPTSTGWTITTSGWQTIHTFTTSGTFTMVAYVASTFTPKIIIC